MYVYIIYIHKKLYLFSDVIVRKVNYEPFNIRHKITKGGDFKCVFVSSDILCVFLG